MGKISVVSFVYNEEKHIDAWLSQLKPYVHEIVIFDLESTDKTYELCLKYTDKVFRRPYLLIGDTYKQELAYTATGDWLLWAYPDERYSEDSLKAFEKLTSGSSSFNAYSFMRHEYMDNIRIRYERDGRFVYFGSPEDPNYQMRLIKVTKEVFYTELIHFQVGGTYKNCGLPPEFYMEHFKSSVDQEFDNIRSYIMCKYLVWKYGETQIEPYRRYIQSYKKIIADSEKYNREGKRRVHPAEEEWWKWKEIGFEIDKDIKDNILRGMENENPVS